ncbi:TIGR03066 family protein [Zavarzinella formosa]|uniref:TIGR03066 family protein n=1 Tax=Zavarzinella formosa TaxID=360055 RepID=UPI0012F83B3E|nr:TIGR03066 family protein [Zavarzinella formosa]
MKKFVASLVTLVVFAGFAAAETKIDAAKIVGKWEVTKTDGEAPKGAIVEFLKDGKLAIAIDLNGKKFELGGTYKVDGAKLTVKISVDGKEQPEDTDTIKSLTDEEMVTIDKDKKETTFKKKK